jgi:ribonucleoside-diphosphate reductase alpha chain
MSEILSLGKVVLSVDEKGGKKESPVESRTLKDFKNELEEPQFTKNGIEILEKRYLNKDEDKQNETPKDLLIRVAQFIANAEKNYGKSPEQVLETAKDFYSSMARLEFFPNSPTLRGAGTKIHQLAACFVLPIEDSLEGIFDTLKNTALIHKGGGGTGFSFGRLRPSGDKVGSTGGVAGGPISFMNIFDTLAREVMQGGTRVGANMGILPVNHPDILEWITCKTDGKNFQNFNLSVSVSDEFMDKINENLPYDLINPRNKQKVGQLNAGDVYDKMIDNAWKNGDPGIIFIDKMNKDNPTPSLGEIESTNPCGEQPLLPYESCNLGSINLAKFVQQEDISWEKLRKTVRLAVRFLDNVIDVNKYFVPQIEKMTKGNRKIGLGVMGFADMLVSLNIPYNSEEAITLAEKIMKFVQDSAKEMSEDLAKERGVFPNWDKSIYAKAKSKRKLRNATVTTIAPTGTLSLLGNCAGGIEPFFAIVYKKKSIYQHDGTASLEQIYINPAFEKIAKERKIYSEELMGKIADHGNLADLEEVPEDIKRVFVTAHDIKPVDHIKMQAAFQKHTDNAVSKTINFPREATVEDIKNAYILAYKLGCKGLTIYRDGSKENQVLTTGKTTKVDEEGEQTQTIVASGVTIVPRERPDIIRGFTYRIKTAYGKLYVTVNDDENGQPFEVFSHLGKAGGFFAAKAEAICRLISLALRSGVDPEEVISQLKGIRGPTPTWMEDGRMILSLPDGIAQILEKHVAKEQTKLDLDFKTAEQPKLGVEKIQMSNGYSAQPKSLADYGEAPACPDCGAMLELSEGCLKCPSCGFSKCG